jgi:ABC-type phosphate/phosphonate transport system substrate-binding protein
MVFVVGDAEAAAIDGERLADSFMEEEDLVIEVRLTEDYAEALDSLCGGEATVASLNSFGYIYASDLGCAELFFVEEQNGKTAEQGQIVVSVTRGIFGVIALRAQDFCRVDSASMLSWIVPSLRMRVDNIDPLNDLTSVVDAGSDAEVFRLVLNNTCDVGATSFGAELDYPEIPNIDRIRVIEELPPVPNDVIAFSPLTPPELRPVIRDLLRSFDDDLADIVEADGLVEEEDALFVGLRDLVQQSRIDLEAYAR